LNQILPWLNLQMDSVTFFIFLYTLCAFIFANRKHLFFRDERQNIRSGWAFRKHTGFAPANSYFAKASRLKNRLKAERAWFLSEEGRRAKPETEHLMPRWGKRCVFLSPLA